MKYFFAVIFFLYQMDAFGQVYKNTTSGEVPQQPEFIGGQEAFKKFIDKNFQLPDSVRNGFFEGTIFLNMTISEDGSISKTEIIISEKSNIKYCDQCKKEALRISKLLPKFKPGTLDGKPTVTVVALPIKFKNP